MISWISQSNFRHEGFDETRDAIKPMLLGNGGETAMRPQMEWKTESKATRYRTKTHILATLL